jgi:hypothetical protein
VASDHTHASASASEAEAMNRRSQWFEVIGPGCKRRCSETLLGRTGSWVPIGCPSTQTHQPTAHKKDLQMQAFQRAAEGIRTLDLLHGKQFLLFMFGADIPCKCRGSWVWVSCCDSPAFTASSREFRHPMGTRA